MKLLESANRRILVVDDNPDIHGDFRKIFAPPGTGSEVLGGLESALFGVPDGMPAAPAKVFELDSAFQGEEALVKVQAALTAERPYAMAFLDVRMPPGWDGMETAMRLWEADPELQIVLCTAYSDYSWEQTLAKLGVTDRLLILKKPFDTIEVKQIAHALTEKWLLGQSARLKLEDLEARVKQRTRELQQMIADRERMEVALRRAQKLESLGQLVAGIAHEINNPLAFVLSGLSYFADELREGEEAFRQMPLEEVRAVLREGTVGAQRIQRIVEDLKSFKRLRDEAMGPVEIEACVDMALARVAQALGDKARVVKQLQGAPTVQAHSVRLATIFQALLVNAAQATPELASPDAAPRDIVVRASVGEDGRAVVEVEDSGGGMPPEVMERIFDPFFTTQPVGQGTGLGLTICHELLAVFGGEISVKSTPGMGSTFTLSLPRATEAHASPPRALAG